jgi:Ca2+-binding EF-hand superfamily protein
MECLKLYDKEENGMMLIAELEHSLKALGKCPTSGCDATEDIYKFHPTTFQ